MIRAETETCNAELDQTTQLCSFGNGRRERGIEEADCNTQGGEWSSVSNEDIYEPETNLAQCRKRLQTDKLNKDIIRDKAYHLRALNKMHADVANVFAKAVPFKGDTNICKRIFAFEL